MGSILQKLFEQNKNPPHVLLMGLDSAGKSTLLFRLHQGVIMDTSPTIGFNVVTLELGKKTALTVWDVGGQKKMQGSWKYFLEGCKALVFVVDATDHSRIEEARTALKNILSNNNMQDMPLIVLVNKMDLPNSMTINEASINLNLESYTDRVWEIQACSAVTGLGLKQAFLSVARIIRKTQGQH